MNTKGGKELKPCPFCPRSAPYIPFNGGIPQTVKCKSCGAQAPIIIWNTRKGAESDGQRPMNQKDRLIRYLKTHKTINPLESWQSLGIYRLSDVVFRLKKDGYDIRTEKISVNNQFGESCRVAKYHLVES